MEEPREDFFNPYSFTYLDNWDIRVLNDQPAPSRQWQRIAGLYSALVLTKNLDCLPALSGLASRATPHLGEYLAGLWSSTFPLDLLWRVDKLTENIDRPKTYRGPSWSWVSADSTVLYWDDLRTSIARPEVSEWIKQKPTWISWKMTPVGENKFGQVSDGGVFVEGYLRQARLQYVWTRPWLSEGSGERMIDPLRYELNFDIELPFFADYVLCNEGPHHIKDQDTLFLFLVHPDVCLVLQKKKMPGAYIASYQRVGIVLQPRTFARIYAGAINWMAGSEKSTFQIV